jgi:hypothetical protein
MNHPKPEEWVPYVFGEVTGAARRELRAHLRDCQQCREEVETWKRSLGRLDSWRLSRLRFSSELIFPVLKFAAAAAIMLAVGISIGRATAPKVDPNQVLRAVAPEVQRQVNLQMSELVRQEVSRTASLILASDHHYTDQIAEKRRRHSGIQHRRQSQANCAATRQARGLPGPDNFRFSKSITDHSNSICL